VGRREKREKRRERRRGGNREKQIQSE